MRTVFSISFFAGVMVGSVLVYALTNLQFSKSPAAIGYSAAIVLTEENEDGTMEVTDIRTPYDLTGGNSQASLMRISPDETKVLYTVWEDVGVSIYIADVDHNNAKMIARQEATEGSGGIDMNSISWLDNESIGYQENSVICEGVCDNPGDFESIITTYQVDIATGVKTRIGIE